ncbi:UDP-N-acetyl-D-glucosamine dehydrogenase [Nocardioides sp. Soil797]|nr:UDP-N-acetyl-D-glucosamine dehydrogenase [Nocardioides sp. Soil797]
MPDHVVIVGQGYVGLPLAIRASEAGLKITGFDVTQSLVDQLNLGESHIDDIPSESLRTAIAAGYTATTSPAVMADADVVVVCVPTPLSKDGGPDLEAVRASAITIGNHIQGATLVILESTSYPGTTEEIFAPLVLGDSKSLDDDAWIAFSPERVDPGNADYGIRNTPKVVGGLSKESRDKAVAFYSRFIDSVVPVKGAKEAEMTKLLENTFRHVNIALVNEMLRFSNDFDIDIWDVIDAAATKPFGFMPFRPGPGVGGHCIPVDPSYLSHRVKAELGYSFRMVELAEEINLAAPGYVATRVWELLNQHRKAVNGAKVLLLGVTYKPDIADVRETPAEPIAEKLVSWGADVYYHDPFVHEWTIAGDVVPRASEAYAEDISPDVTILLQAHSEYDLGRLAQSRSLVLDTRGVLPPTPKVHRL